MRHIIALIALCIATPAHAQLYNPPTGASVDTSTLATKDEVQAAAQAALDAQSAASAAASAMPSPAVAAPPSVADSGTRGTMTTQYALANHTHASKARKGRVLVPVAGTFDVVFGTPFVTGAPICSVVAETAPGDTNIVNAQIDGVTTINGFRLRITRTQATVASLLGLTVLSVPVQIATQAHYICIEP